ncbi:putative ankyrin repeat protein [Phytophthora citrophthora]|uniref:Ankyrin repeat protein n=1 Tax=Phytophthora citrophthora TaxID=4793 RepID=A0AAD9LIN5_9STRA|nr:putative ankyrin repeat protein [Phytophthora citrophthora]
MKVSPAAQVLTSKALLLHIVSFMDGLPLAVFKFACAQRFRARLEGRYPSSRGLLPQLAVICEEYNVLDALLRLVGSYSSSYRNHDTEFHGVVRCAVRFDKLNMLQWLERKLELSSYEFEADLMDIAVAHTKGVDVMNWLLVNHVGMEKKVSSWALRLAAYNGEVVKMKWLHTHGFRGFSCTTADDAACAGNANVLRFLVENRREGCSSQALDQAAMHGHIEVVRYLFSFIHGRSETERQRVTARASFAMTKAAMCGHAEVVGFLGRRQVTPLSHTLLDVVATGELQVLKELCRYSNEGCLVEARKQAKLLGHTDMAAFLRTQIVPTAWACRQHRHSRSGPRRCQRKAK